MDWEWVTKERCKNAQNLPRGKLGQPAIQVYVRPIIIILYQTEFKYNQSVILYFLQMALSHQRKNIPTKNAGFPDFGKSVNLYLSSRIFDQNNQITQISRDIFLMFLTFYGILRDTRGSAFYCNQKINFYEWVRWQIMTTTNVLTLSARLIRCSFSPRRSIDRIYSPSLPELRF